MCVSAAPLRLLGSGGCDSSRQCVHSGTDNSTAGRVCMGECVCMCERGSQTERASASPSCFASLILCSSLSLPLSLCPPSHQFSSQLPGFYPFPSLHVLSIISFLSLSCLLPPPPPPLSPLSLCPPPPSFSSRASLLAADATEAEAEATVSPLAAIHKLAIKKTEAKKS